MNESKAFDIVNGNWETHTTTPVFNPAYLYPDIFDDKENDHDAFISAI